MPEHNSHQNAPIWHGLLAGAISGVASRAIVHPADTVKARLQVQGALPQSQRYSSTLSAARQMAYKEGVLSFYTGFGAVLWGVIPANLAYFGGYELGKRIMPSTWGLLGDMGTGAVAQLLAGVIYTPVDIVKERLQVQALMGGAYSYGSARQAFLSLTKDRGLSGLFKGYWATNCVWLPWNIIYIATYEQSKKRMCTSLHKQSNKDLPAWSIATCSGASAAFAALLTHPADVVKTRLQVLSATADGANLTAVAIAKQMLKQEGPSAFTHGLLARMLHTAPGCMLSWMFYEKLKAWIDELTPP
eukprot:jgi/Chrzof1/11176/Cz05g26210.t1